MSAIKGRKRSLWVQSALENSNFETAKIPIVMKQLHKNTVADMKNLKFIEKFALFNFDILRSQFFFQEISCCQGSTPNLHVFS